MKYELERVKNDVETMQRALGLAPAMEREWVPWLKRDKWLNLVWALPGLILLTFSFLPFGRREKYLGLLPNQWMGVLAAAALLGVLVVGWKLTTNGGRPQSLVREYKRFYGIDGHGKWVSLALFLEFLLYFIWAFHFRISTQAFMSGLFIIMGATYLVITVISKLWLLFGVAIPFLVFGLYEALFAGKGPIGGISLGMMFIGIGLLGFIIQTWQIRKIERENESH